MTASRGIRSRRCGTVAERFAQNTRAEPGPDGCIVWTAATNDAGYGVTWDGTRTRLAHRLAWEEEYGPLDGDVVLRHKVCDNPPCVRLSHLAPGDHADNVRDKVAKRRHHFGSKSPSSKLTEGQAQSVLDRVRFGRTGNVVDLASEFEIGVGAVRDIANRRTWKHLERTTEWQSQRDAA